MTVCTGLLDDFTIFSGTPDDHFDYVSQVLTLLNDTGVTLNLKKYEFVTNGIDYFAHLIQPGRLEVLTQTIDAIHRL